MKILYSAIVALVLGEGAAYGQQPPDSVLSDLYGNTAMGGSALMSLPDPPSCPATGAGSGCNNTAAGARALRSNTTGSFNTATGGNALQANTTGIANTASGLNAMFFNSTGSYNTAYGLSALKHNNGEGNTAFGVDALYYNQTGTNNTATGANALQNNDESNTGVSGNTADGAGAMFNNTIGTNNSAVGFQALTGAMNASGVAEATGSNNTGVGVNSLYSYSTGGNNTAVGVSAMYNSTTGSGNIAVGYEAGENLTTGVDDIEIGNKGVAGDSKVIRVGTQGTQTKTYLAGIYGVSVTGSPVYVSSSGQLGVVVSSERFKTAIEPMGSGSAKLDELRPVMFKLKSDAAGTRQYGLIAEEVAKVYPELAIRDQHGRIDGVRYDELAPMLLNELQQQRSRSVAQDAEISRLKEQLAEIRAALASR